MGMGKFEMHWDLRLGKDPEAQSAVRETPWLCNKSSSCRPVDYPCSGERRTRARDQVPVST